ncbi:MAG: pyrroloquinoline quinone biosynthesis protein PqqB [Rhodospirillales bacterium]|nr:pyrroloquinoline quinone biosynthesis protein PqqB [Rhodospirillales bacterium]MSP80526.1 pyrroloquinoline quinone biosynthesis protein PqqB [Rhodospirillales bacterium]
MRIVVLGSAAGGGFPQWNCNCANCRRARAGDPAARPRTQSSLAVSADGDRWLLLNASPDLRQQIAASPALNPSQPGRHSPIAAVTLTNGDVDHVAGLLSLRESQPLALYASARVLASLAANSIFNVLAPEIVARRELSLAATVKLADRDGRELGLEVRAFAVPGKVALYLENAADPGFGTRPGDALGLEVRGADGRGFFYLPGCAEMPPALARRLKGAGLVFFDGTLWRNDEMIAAGVGTKTGQRMGHMSVSGPDGALAAFASLGVGRKIFIHVNNTNPILLDDSRERAETVASGWEVAFDGMEIVL